MVFLQIIMLWITILIMWYVILMRMMRGIKTVKVIKDEKRLVRNMPIIIAILISLGAFGISYFSYLSSTEANAIAKQTLYNQEHADEIFNEKFYNHTNGKVLIYYPGNQTGDMRREQILMILNNTLPEGLKDVAFISSINIANAEQHAKIDLDNNGYKIRYRPQIERDNNLTNNSIFTWSRNIPSGDLFIILNVTWDKAWRQANIKEPNISFEMSAYDKPIKNLTIREVNESEITSRYRLLRPDLYP